MDLILIDFSTSARSKCGSGWSNSNRPKAQRVFVSLKIRFPWGASPFWHPFSVPAITMTSSASTCTLPSVIFLESERAREARGLPNDSTFWSKQANDSTFWSRSRRFSYLSLRWAQTFFRMCIWKRGVGTNKWKMCCQVTVRTQVNLVMNVEPRRMRWQRQREEESEKLVPISSKERLMQVREHAKES